MPRSTPVPLLIGAVLVALEGAVLLLLGGLEVAAAAAGRLTLAITTATFFVLFGVGLLFCAWALRSLHSWARGPVVFAQLVQLGLAWNLRGGETTYVALGLSLVAGVVLVAVLHPVSTRAIGHE